jgi:hypothetical protein
MVVNHLTGNSMAGQELSIDTENLMPLSGLIQICNLSTMNILPVKLDRWLKMYLFGVTYQ